MKAIQNTILKLVNRLSGKKTDNSAKSNADTTTSRRFSYTSNPSTSINTKPSTNYSSRSLRRIKTKQPLGLNIRDTLLVRRSLGGEIQTNRNVRIIGFTSSISLLFLVIATLAPIYNIYGTENSEAATESCSNSGNASLGTNCSMTFTATKMTATADLTVSNTSGTFASSSDGEKASFSIETNNAKGYELTIVSTSNTALTNTDDDTKSFSVIAGSGISESSFDNNTWGYLPNYYNSSTNTNYYPISTTTTTLDKTESSNTNNAKEYNIGIGAKATYALPAGTYTNSSIILSYVANPTPFTITFNKNTTDTVTNMPYSTNNNTVSSNVSGTSVNITDGIPVRDGYNFLGWCSTTTTNTNNTDSCSGTTYNSEGNTTWQFPIDRTSTITNTVTLYAMWGKESLEMQSLKESDCTTTLTTATDSRDGEEYYIQRLADGNCWMLDNLRLDLTNSTVISNLSTANTHAEATALNKLINGGGTTSDRYPTAGLTKSNWTSGNSYSVPLVNVSGTCSTSNNCTYNGNYTKDTVAPVTYGDGSGKIGVYYNYCAASAGYYCYGNGTSEGTSSGNSDYDICPKGWRMPTGGSSGEYKALYTAYSSNATNFRDTLSTPLSGYFFYNGTTHDQGSYGSFWSSTRNDSYYMYSLSVTPSSVNPQYINYRSSGFSVRCILQPQSTITFNFDANITSVAVKDNSYNTVATITSSGSTAILIQGATYTISPTFASGYFQDSMTLSGSGTLSGNSFTVGTSTSTINITSQAYVDLGTMQNLSYSNCTTSVGKVTDSRDGEEYVIQRLADGNCWMLDNLRLDLTNSTVISNLSTANTHAEATALNKLINGGGTTSDRYPTAGLTKSNWTTGYSYSAPLVNVSGTCGSSCTNSGATYTKDTVAPTTYGNGSGKIGVYYNYCAASAGYYCYGNGGNNTGSPSGNSDYDICPYGWKMPSGDTANGSYYYLYNTGYSANVSNFQNALSTPLSGYFSSGATYFQGSLGYFWSSTRYTSGNSSMYTLDVNSSSVNPQNHDGRYSGLSVRCILQPTMQGVDQASLAALVPNVGNTVNLVDNRDGETYLIGKLADGKYWMLDNLRLGSDSAMTLTSDDTNITSTVGSRTLR